MWCLLSTGALLRVAYKNKSLAIGFMPTYNPELNQIDSENSTMIISFADPDDELSIVCLNVIYAVDDDIGETNGAE